MGTVRIGPLTGALVLAALLSSGCPPKGGGVGVPTPVPTAVPTPVPFAWAPQAKTLVDLAFTGPSALWNDPPVRPGERLRWVTSGNAALPERFFEVRRGTADADGTQRWTLAAGAPDRVSHRVALGVAADRITSIAFAAKDATPETMTQPPDIARVAPPASFFPTANEATFTAAGGTFLGNEVVRVPAGEFRARHGVVTAGATTWHLYVVRAVPGGLVKAERFDAGSDEPSLVLELDEFEKLAPPPPPPAPTPAPQ